MPLGTPSGSTGWTGKYTNKAPGTNASGYGWSTGSPAIASKSSATYKPALGTGASMGTGNGGQSAVQQWLSSQMGANNALYSSQLGGITGQANAARAATNSQVGYNNQAAALNSQLLQQQRFRDVTLGQQQNDLTYRGQTSAYHLGTGYNADQVAQQQARYTQNRNDIINGQTNARKSWDEEQRYIGQLQGFGVNAYNLNDSILDQGVDNAGRDLGYAKDDAGALSAESQNQYNLTVKQLGEQAGMSQRELDNAMKDIAAGKVTNDARYQELMTGLSQAGVFNTREWAEVQRSVGADRDIADRSFAELNRDITSRQGTTDESIDIQRWLNAQQGGTNDAGLDLSLRQSEFNESEQKRKAKSDAIARGGAISKGYGDDLSGFRQGRNFNDEGATQQWSATRDALGAQLRGDENAYTAALNQLTGARNQGQIGYDADLNQLTSRTNQGQQAYDQNAESIRSQYANGKISYDDAVNQLNSQKRGAQLGYDRDILGYDQTRENAGFQNTSNQAAIDRSRRNSQTQYDDTIQGIGNQRDQSWLDYQQSSAALQNRTNTGQLGYDAQRNSLNSQSRNNTMSLNEQLRSLQYQQSMARNQFGQQTGMYGINNQSLQSLGQTYGTRNQAASVGNSSQNAALQNQLAQSLYGYGQQGMGLLQQQQQANASLYGQAMYGGW